LFILVGLTNCTDNTTSSSLDPSLPDANSSGSGVFEFNEYEPFESKTINVYYHIPENVDANSRILFVFHGNGRNAFDYRNAMIAQAEEYNFIVVAPQFSSQDFPGGDGYNMGNVFVDGDNPTAETLNPEEEWTFSVIEPLFDYFRDLIGNLNTSYDVFGHSAGGQFAHRYIMFKPDANVNKVVASGSGWYTMPNLMVNFPYGYSNSPLEFNSLQDLYQQKLIVLIGELDNDPNATGLRRNEFADVQGDNRFERAQYFYNYALENAQQLGVQLNWQIEVNSAAGHSYLLAASKGAELLYND
jgi:pimeloyl-ACP methyl ester carboxylesterase